MDIKSPPHLPFASTPPTAQATTEPAVLLTDYEPHPAVHCAAQDPHSSTEPGAPRWVPALRLPPERRPHMLTHLLALSPEDRYLRFGHAAADAQIERYVQSIDLQRDDVFGVFNRRLDLVALVHLAYPAGEAPSDAEFGISVSAHLRGKGFGKRLFEHAMLLARNRKVSLLRIHALAENKPMLHIARVCGATVERHGADAEAVLRLPQADTVSRLEEWLESQAAEIDYTVKQQVQRIDKVRSALTGHN